MTRRPLRRPALALACLTATFVVAMGAPAGASGAPYTDPNSTGYIGLCDQAGDQITSGNVNTVPFAWRAVSSVPAPVPYNDATRTAILFAYQPIENVPSAEWSGEELTSSSRYSNPKVPMAAATNGDDSMADFVSDFPTKWDGFVQLRMYFGAANQQPYNLNYPTLDIQVTGDTWQAVDGGPVDCGAGTSISIETILLPAMTTTTTTTTTSPGATTTSPAASKGTPGSTAPPAPSGAKGSPDTQGHGAARAEGLGATSTSNTSSTPWLLLAIALAVVAVGVVGFVVLRRRARRAVAPATGPDGDRDDAT